MRLLDEPAELVDFTMDAKPHNGAPGFQNEQGIGGQMLLLHLCLQYPRTIAPVGRRFGKTSGIGFLILEEGSRTHGRYNIGVFEQDHAKAKEVFEIYLAAFGGDPKKNPNSLVRKVHRSEGQDRWFELHGTSDVNTGTRAYFWSGKHPHYNAVRGIMHSFHRIVIDEASLIRQQCVTKTVLPMLMDAGGKLLVIGTPDIEQIGHHWFETFWSRAVSEKAEWDDYSGMNFPSEANPHLKEGAVAQMRAECMTQDEELQEIDARFLDNISGVFGHLSKYFVLDYFQHHPVWLQKLVRGCKVENLEAWIHEEPQHRVPYLVTGDWARKRDSTVIDVWRLDNGRQAACFELANDDYESQLEFVVGLRHVYGNGSIHCDGNGVGDGMVNALQKRFNEHCVPHIWGPYNKESYVRTMQILMKTGGIKLINCERQREQFRIYIGEKDEKSGKIKYSHPDGENDDFVDAALYAVEALMVPFHPEEEQEREEEERAARMGRGEMTYNDLRHFAEAEAWVDYIGGSQI